MFVAATLTLFGGVGVSYYTLFVADVVESVGGVGTVMTTQGVVEVRVQDGGWRAVQPGDRVHPGTDVRTGLEAEATLRYGDYLKVAVRGDSRLRVARLDNRLARFVLDEGFTVIDVDPLGQRRVEVAALGSQAVAHTEDGRLHLFSDGANTLEAAVTRGQAVLRSQGESVELLEGFQSRVRAGEVPMPPVAVPASLFLQVKWPEVDATAKIRHRVAGRTNPGVRVRIGNRVVVADSAGNFSTVVELAEGANTVTAAALDVVGRLAQEASSPIHVDTQGPGLEIQTSPGMWNGIKNIKQSPENQIISRPARKNAETPAARH